MLIVSLETQSWGTGGGQAVCLALEKAMNLHEPFCLEEQGQDSCFQILDGQKHNSTVSIPTLQQNKFCSSLALLE